MVHNISDNSSISDEGVSTKTGAADSQWLIRRNAKDMSLMENGDGIHLVKERMVKRAELPDSEVFSGFVMAETNFLDSRNRFLSMIG